MNGTLRAALGACVVAAALYAATQWQDRRYWAHMHRVWATTLLED